MITNRNIKISILIVWDLMSMVLSSFLALVLRFDVLSIPYEYLNGAKRCIPVYMILAISVLLMLKLYSRIWSFATSRELFQILEATMLLEVLFVSYHVFRGIPMPRSYYILQFFLMSLLLSLPRFIKVFSRNIKVSRINRAGRNTMIIGAGSAGYILIKDLNSQNSKYVVTCAIDDNEYKAKKYILGVPIVGTRDDIAEAVQRYAISDIFISMPSASPKDLKEIITICQKTGKPIKILPSVTKSLSSSVSSELRPIQYEDLLGRDPIEVNQEGLFNFITGKTILVTGGGGTIGSELCRQIAKYKPLKLIVFDIYENNAYSIQMELERHYPTLDISTLIGSVRDYERLSFVFEKYRPDIIYHAAAHKHVPLMEKSPNEAIKNNCLGTLNCAKLAEKYEADNFILISTDKAVRPTNIMGATKRVCEMIIQSFARTSKHTRFNAVRFGNVLGSNGSVIPLFLKQIDEGGPVTVTHPDIVRYFMTIPEAVSLVLQATLFAKGGEIFVLDMGKPVKIYDLAENLIRLKGYTPNEDIEIKIIGLRPGEKLKEELLMEEEGLQKTKNNMIYIGRPININYDDFMHNLDFLISESMKNGWHIKEAMEKVCTTYHITDNA